MPSQFVKCLILALVVPWNHHDAFVIRPDITSMPFVRQQYHRRGMLLYAKKKKKDLDDDPIDIDDVMSEVAMALREADSALSTDYQQKQQQQQQPEREEPNNKSIEIDDVMSEVAMALREADNALTVSTDDYYHPPSLIEQNSIEIDDVMSEVVMALREADTALSTASSSPKNEIVETKKQTTTSSAITYETSENQLSREQVKDVVSSSMGGIVLGAGLGALINSKIPDIGSMVEPAVPPILLAIIFGVVGIVGGLTDSKEGEIVRTVLGAPTAAAVSYLVNFIISLLESIGLAAKRKVEQGANEIKALPGKLANSAATKAQETADEIKSIPNRVGNAAKRKVMETLDDVRYSLDRSVAEITSLPRKVVESDQLVPLLLIPSMVAVGFVLLAT